MINRCQFIRSKLKTFVIQLVQREFFALNLTLNNVMSFVFYKASNTLETTSLYVCMNVC